MSDESPIDVLCRHCEAPTGEKCTTVPLATSNFVRVLGYFHATRWRDFNHARAERAAMVDWNKKYGGKTA